MALSCMKTWFGTKQVPSVPSVSTVSLVPVSFCCLVDKPSSRPPHTPHTHCDKHTGVPGVPGVPGVVRQGLVRDQLFQTKVGTAFHLTGPARFTIFGTVYHVWPEHVLVWYQPHQKDWPVVFKFLAHVHNSPNEPNEPHKPNDQNNPNDPNNPNSCVLFNLVGTDSQYDLVMKDFCVKPQTDCNVSYYARYSANYDNYFDMAEQKRQRLAMLFTSLRNDILACNFHMSNHF